MIFYYNKKTRINEFLVSTVRSDYACETTIFDHRDKQQDGAWAELGEDIACERYPLDSSRSDLDAAHLRWCIRAIKGDV